MVNFSLMDLNPFLFNFRLYDFFFDCQQLLFQDKQTQRSRLYNHPILKVLRDIIDSCTEPQTYNPIIICLHFFFFLLTSFVGSLQILSN